ncbi:MarR family transcriptional regulator [Corynebacterium poyangense]|uniref:MarR family transcriptional regulator n=1 Tax=Corynebacterium poyangense TaxID=2684405 RepID=A0A7H0SR93_9CORY|nr:MarR family transcriptional regulator [Corynebacterium poyangense]MBZ8176499.1 MarR family transcriptional regulator [Corynebacterium poyangense]QNQ91068.1 MarR family transcriptional regulator [Corynebacterium poyangense]
MGSDNPHSHKSTSYLETLAEAKRQWAKRHSDTAAEGLVTISWIIRGADILRRGAEDVLKPFGVTFNQFELLTMLSYSRAGGLPMSKINSRLQLPPPSLTHLVGKLDAKGLVTRVPNDKDRRSTLVSISESGLELLERSTKHVNEYFENVGLNQQDQQSLCRLMAKLRDPLERE